MLLEGENSKLWCDLESHFRSFNKKVERDSLRKVPNRLLEVLTSRIKSFFRKLEKLTWHQGQINVQAPRKAEYSSTHAKFMWRWNPSKNFVIYGCSSVQNAETNHIREETVWSSAVEGQRGKEGGLFNCVDSISCQTSRLTIKFRATWEGEGRNHNLAAPKIPSNDGGAKRFMREKPTGKH